MARSKKKTQVTSSNEECAISSLTEMRKQWSQLHGQVSENPRKAEHPGFRRVRMVSEPGSRGLQWETRWDAENLLGAQVVEFLGLLERALLTLCRFAPLGISDSLSLSTAFPTFYSQYFLKAPMCTLILLPLKFSLLMTPRGLCSTSRASFFYIIWRTLTANCPLFSVFLNSNSWKLDGWSQLILVWIRLFMPEYRGQWTSLYVLTALELGIQPGPVTPEELWVHPAPLGGARGLAGRATGKNENLSPINIRSAAVGKITNFQWHKMLAS